MIIAIIGGAGRMGTWFARYFLERGNDVVISDINVDKAREAAERIGARFSESNIEAVKGANLVLVSTPIEETPRVLTEVLPEVDCGTIVAEIASLKSKILPVLKKAAARGIRVLSLHPLFGPGAQKLSGEKIALVPVADPATERKLAMELFPEAIIIPVDCEVHDRIMALTLALTHSINIIFASIICEEDISMLKCLGGTTFTIQCMLSEAVMSEDPALYASIQMNNEHVTAYLDKLIERAVALRDIIRSRDYNAFIKFYMEIRNQLIKDAGFLKAYGKMYSALEVIRREDE